MSATLSNGKVTIGDNSLTIKGLFGQSKVIQKKKITNIDKTGSKALGIWYCILVFPILGGLRMLKGNVLVKISHSYDEEFEFWMKGSDYPELLSLL